MKNEHIVILVILILVYLWWSKRQPIDDVTVKYGFPGLEDTSSKNYSPLDGQDPLSRIIAGQGNEIKRI